jgi:lysophospholipid acyltransferase (LPLAT)-like uncharacterized protein
MRLKNLLNGYVVFFIYKALSSTWRVKFDESRELIKRLSTKQPVIFAHWHGEELALLQVTKRYRLATLTSQSRDGELMTFVLRRLGVTTTRGSSSRGGSSGLRQLIRICRHHGYNISFAVDGPRGPIHKVKPGIFETSRLMQSPIYVASAHADRYWLFTRTWNQAMLPKPFATVTIRINNGMDAIEKAEDPRSPALASQLEQLLSH